MAALIHPRSRRLGENKTYFSLVQTASHMNLVMLLLQHTAFCVIKFYDSTLKCNLADEMNPNMLPDFNGIKSYPNSNFIVAGNCDNVAQAVDNYFLNVCDYDYDYYN